MWHVVGGIRCHVACDWWNVISSGTVLGECGVMLHMIGGMWCYVASDWWNTVLFVI